MRSRGSRKAPARGFTVYPCPERLSLDDHDVRAGLDVALGVLARRGDLERLALGGVQRDLPLGVAAARRARLLAVHRHRLDVTRISRGAAHPHDVTVADRVR